MSILMLRDHYFDKTSKMKLFKCNFGCHPTSIQLQIKNKIEKKNISDRP